MKRRTFIIATVAFAAAIAIPSISYHRKHTLPADPLIRPHVLGHFCDGETINEIGINYRAQVPEENKEKKLVELLLTNDKGKKIEPGNSKAVSELLEQKIQQEFKEGRIVIEDGWVLSETEARQCALFSMSDK
jgi:hypothetical protein